MYTYTVSLYIHYNLMAEYFSSKSEALNSIHSTSKTKPIKVGLKAGGLVEN